MNDNPSRAVDIFAVALELPAGERAGYLARECGNDHALKARVEALLRADSDAGAFMEAPPAAAPSRSTPAVGEKPGDRIGRYKLLQQIGEGGCGVVFMAEQEEPVHRKVALKIIKPGMDTRSVIARFEAERQALALMDHPNIAKVFDAGATASGRPFFVMELIRGIKITDYCDQHLLTTAERLELFVQVCQAVQHAHQKGIIHRDIKPSNILVTTTGQSSALPMVIDFGIAKATTNQRLTDKTLFTAFEMLIGTPAYMSPEQAALTNVDVDTRTDIYSLGVLLYELLTGSTPFDASALLKAGLDEIRRVICEAEPARPSTRLNTMAGAALTTVAQHRRSEPPNLIRTVRGDLDWIVMKALEKDRTRRYETTNGLALDIKRHLANETVSARPPSRLYKLQKTIQRNKLLFLGIAFMTVLLVGSLAVVLMSLAKERRARQIAETEENRSRQVTRFLKRTLEGVGPSVAVGRDTVMLREILDRTAGELGIQSSNQPVVEAEIRGILGPIYLELGQYETAEAMARDALALRTKLNGSQSPEAATALNNLGLALWKQRKLADAEAAFQEALAIRRTLFGTEHPDVAATLNLLGAVYRRQGKHKESEALTRQSLEIRRKLFGTNHLEVAESLRNLSIVLTDRGKRPEAEAAAREMLATRRQLLGTNHPLVALSLSDLAHVLGGKSPEGERLETEAFGIQWKVLADEHPDLARSIFLLGDRLRNRGELAEAHAVLSAALTLQRRLLGEDHPDTVVTLRRLITILQQEGKWAEVEGLHRQALELQRQRGEADDADVATEIGGIVRALRKQSRFAEAEQLLEVEISPAFSNKSARAKLLAQRAELAARQGRWDEALADLNQCVELQPKDLEFYRMLAPVIAVTRNRPIYEQFCRKLLQSFATTNLTNPYTAERLVTDCLLLSHTAVDLNQLDQLADIAVTLGRKETPNLPSFHLCKAMANYRLARYTNAVSWAEKVPESAPIFVRAHTSAVLAMALWQLGLQTEAQAMLAKGEQLVPGVTLERGTEKFEGDWVPWIRTRVVMDEATSLIQPDASGQNSTEP